MQNKLFFLVISVYALFNNSMLFSATESANKSAIVIKKICKTRKEKRQERRKKFQLAPRRRLVAKGIRDQEEHELRNNLEIYLHLGNDDLVVKYLEALIAKINEFEEIRDLRLQLADCYFKNKQYMKAGSIYTEYYESYPGYEKAEYALYQAIAAKFKQIRACDQDNIIMQEVLDLSKNYLQNKSYKKYRDQIMSLFEVCNNQLLESEIQIFEHYFKQGYLAAAQRRLDYITEKILPKMIDIKTRIDGLQDLINQAKGGKNPFKLLKNFHNSQNYTTKAINTSLEVNNKANDSILTPYAEQF